MKTSESEKLWSISILDGRAKVSRNSIPLRSNNNGREYGFLLGVPVKVQSAGDKFIQLEFESQKESGNSSRKIALFKAKYFNKFKSSPPFDKCSSKDTNKLAEQLSQALDSLDSRHSSVGVAGVATSTRTKNDTPQTPQNVDYATTRTRTSVERITDSPKDVDVASAPRERNTPQHVVDTSAGGENSESTAGPSRANETPVSTKQPLREKRGLYFHQRTKIRRRNPRKRTSCSDHVTSVLLAEMDYWMR